MTRLRRARDAASPSAATGCYARPSSSRTGPTLVAKALIAEREHSCHSELASELDLSGRVAIPDIESLTVFIAAKLQR